MLERLARDQHSKLTLNYGRKTFYRIGPGPLLKREGKLSVSFKKTVLVPGFEETMKSLKGPHLFSHSWDRSCKTPFCSFAAVAHASDFLSLKLPNCGLVLYALEGLECQG